MKKTIAWALLALLFTSCQDDQKSDKTFTVKGKIGETDAKKIYLVKVPAASGSTMLEDSAVLSKDGRFSLGSNDTESVIYNLMLEGSQYPVASVINDTNLIEIDIRLRPNSRDFAEDYTVKYSPASSQMKEYMFKMNNGLINIYNYTSRADSIMQQGPGSGIADSLYEIARMEGLKLHDYTLKAIDESNNPALTIFELGYYQYVSESTPYGLPLINNDQRMAILNTTTERFPEHKAAASIRAQTAKAIQDMKDASWIGKEAPDFSLPNTSGQPISLKSFRGKYVLVDFWASWCKPCRDENPNVVQAYQQFKSRNFTVLGVSLDQPGQKDKWVEAIRQDELGWTHVSDLKFWESEVVPLYRISGIPYNVLVDPEGKIIAENLRGIALSRKLNELLPQ